MSSLKEYIISVEDLIRLMDNEVTETELRHLDDIIVLIAKWYKVMELDPTGLDPDRVHMLWNFLRVAQGEEWVQIK